MKSARIKKICLLALFCAIAFVSLFIIKIRVSFLTFEFKDALMAIGAMILGPIEGILISLTVSLLEMFLLSDTGIYGFIMNFVSSACFCFVASLVYRKKKSIKFAVIAMFLATLSAVIIMIALNLLITPLFLKTSIEDVYAIIPTLLLPFNIIKYICNSALVLLLYKPVSNALKKAKLVEGKIGADKKTSLSVSIITMAIIAACIIAVLFFMHGNISVF